MVIKDLQIRNNVDLKQYSSIKIGGKARYFCIVESTDDLAAFSRQNEERFYLLGGGSNLLIKDSLIEKPVIKLGKEFDYIKDDGGLIEIGAAASLRSILRYCIEHNLEGWENLAGIPATLGGMLAMNASAFGREVSSFLKKAQILAGRGTVKILDRTNIEFGYRHSSLKDKIILRAWFELRNGQGVRLRIKDFLAQRLQKQDFGYPSCGCVFKNPVGLAAGFLIDSCALKGSRKGGAQVSDKHANFIINVGGAVYDDVDYLIRTIKDKVFQKHSVLLEEEIQRWV